MKVIFGRAVVAEGLGTAMLLAIVVGSGIMGERLAQGNAAIALLANAVATGAGLYVLIVIFGPISGAHFNPVVSLAAAWKDNAPVARAFLYIGAQICGAVIGVIAAHGMFGLPLIQTSLHVRSSFGEGLGEAVATFGLVLAILLTARFRAESVAATVAAYIASAYWFTSSTSFANPAVTLARAMTDTFAGIAPQSVALFLAAQIVGAVAASLLAPWLVNDRAPEA